MLKIALIISLSWFSAIIFGQRAEDVEGLPIGVEAPLFKAIDAGEHTVKLKTLLKKGPVVLVFYRGQWCPVCNKHLKTLQDSLEQIENLGATVIAISPEKPEYLNVMAQKTKASFTLLYDRDYKIMDVYKVTFTPPAATTAMYNFVLNANLKEAHSKDTQQLPVPATYIINRNGVIVWRQFNPNYKKRSSVKAIKQALSAL